MPVSNQPDFLLVSYLCHGCQKWHQFSVRVRLNGSVPGEHIDGPFRYFPRRPFSEEQITGRQTELTSSPMYVSGRGIGNLRYLHDDMLHSMRSGHQPAFSSLMEFCELYRE